MHAFEGMSIKAKNLKCFGTEPQGFDTVKPINLIVGRNNTGKTSLLDLITLVARNNFDADLQHRGQAPEIKISLSNVDKIISLVPEQLHSDMQNKLKVIQEHEEVYRHLRHANVELSLQEGQPLMPQIFNLNAPTPLHSHIQASLSTFASMFLDWFRSHGVIRIAADWDIRPESNANRFVQIRSDDLQASGDGATSILSRMLTNDNHEQWSFIETDIMSLLNRIYGTEGGFRRILSLNRQRPNVGEVSEIFLEDQHGTPVPLSRMGSGVKTILLVLLSLHVLPKFAYKCSPSKLIFCFEELENNLHPAVQRRMFAYLNGFIEEQESHLFVTTHSAVPINIFARNKEIQILHVTQGSLDSSMSTVEPAITYQHHGRIFDDLDIRASDLLQSNCIIWVEGPSDRIYLNKWIQMFDGDLVEHVDYEVAFTGGTVLSHLSYDEPSGADMIEALRLNRHAIILMDKDLPQGAQHLKGRVERVLEELNRGDGLAWVTSGKEVENYIPTEALRIFLGEPDLARPGPDDDVVALVRSRAGKKSIEKVSLAIKICELLNKGMMAESPDWEEKIGEVCQTIRRWNSR